MKTLQLMTLLMLLIGLVALPAAAGDLKDELGYVDLSWIEIPDEADEIQDIDLGHVLKSVAKDAQSNGDTELAKALTMVKSVRLKAFSVDARSEDLVKGYATKIQKQMKKDDWNRLVYMKDKEEEMSVHTKYDDDGNLVGLMVVAIDLNDTATFANVMGDLDLATLMHLIGSMEGDDLEEYLEDLEGVEGIHID